jgi:hypothetical protein
MVLDGGYTSATLSVINRLIPHHLIEHPVSSRDRYERELNSGCRPPLRQISTRDAPAAFPMVLCVSNIFWSAAGATDDGLRIEPYPELEVTDGWYRLRAQVDLAMARAVRRGIIRVGRKIGMAGARVCISSWSWLASNYPFISFLLLALNGEKRPF